MFPNYSNHDPQNRREKRSLYLELIHQFEKVPRDHKTEIINGGVFTTEEKEQTCRWDRI